MEPSFNLNPNSVEEGIEYFNDIQDADKSAPDSTPDTGEYI